MSRLSQTPFLALPLAFCALVAFTLHAQDDRRGRKYTPPPPVAHVVVTVTRGKSDKPVESASVIFHTMRNGKDEGNLEVKTNEEGRAVIDVIPLGEQVRLQIFKNGYQTYGEDFTIDGPSKEIAVRLKPPAGQYSVYNKPPGDAPEQGPAGAKPAAPPQ